MYFFEEINTWVGNKLCEFKLNVDDHVNHIAKLCSVVDNTNISNVNQHFIDCIVTDMCAVLYDSAKTPFVFANVLKILKNAYVIISHGLRLTVKILAKNTELNAYSRNIELLH
jgi:predicted RNA methylase